MKKTLKMRSIPVLLALCLTVAVRGQEPTIAAGPMNGYCSETTATIWLQTTGPAVIQIHYREKDGTKHFISNAFEASRENDFCVHAELTGLDFGTTYRYDVLVNGKKIERPGPPEFSTQQHWRHRRGPPEFKVIFGSCAYRNEKQFDRPGKPYGKVNPIIYDAMTKENAELMVWLGDNLYYREPDWSSRSAMARRFSYARKMPELQAFYATASHVAIWDDHDYGPNNSDYTYPLRDAALDIFKNFWANRTYGTSEIRGTFSRFEWGDAEFFLLDNRYHRSPNKAPRDADKTMFGRPQLRWLLDSLQFSKATFKVICNGSQMLNDMTSPEGLNNFPRDEEILLGELKRRRINGVLFLTGDRHYTELMRLDRKDAYPLHEYTSSPLLSGLSNPPKPGPSTRVPGTLVKKRHNYGALKFSGKSGARQVELICHGEKGEKIWSRILKQADLRMPKKK